MAKKTEKQTVVQPEEKEVVQPEEKEVFDVQHVWLGPSFKDITRFRVYIGELPKTLDDLLSECPLTEVLLVGIDEYTKGLKELEDVTSIKSIAFKKAVKFLTGKE